MVDGCLGFLGNLLVFDLVSLFSSPMRLRRRFKDFDYFPMRLGLVDLKSSLFGKCFVGQRMS